MHRTEYDHNILFSRELSGGARQQTDMVTILCELWAEFRQDSKLHRYSTVIRNLISAEGESVEMRVSGRFIRQIKW
mgnify:CR=1 FL=1